MNNKFQLLKIAVQQINDDQQANSSGGVFNYMANHPIKTTLGLGALAAVGYGGHKLYGLHKSLQPNPYYKGIYSTMKDVYQNPDVWNSVAKNGAPLEYNLHNFINRINNRGFFSRFRRH